MKNNSALFYTCSLIEFIGREQKLKRSELAKRLGKNTLARIYRYADVFHCEPIEKTAGDFIESCNIPQGSFDNVASCRYTVPDYWTIGEVYERLIEDVCGEDEDHVTERLAHGGLYLVDRRRAVQLQHGFLLSAAGLYLYLLQRRENLCLKMTDGRSGY